MSEKVIVFTHRDLDGITAMLLLKKVYPNLKYIAGTYKNIDKSFQREVIDSNVKWDKIFITDISINEEMFKSFLQENTNVHIIDHHPRKEKSIIKNKLIKEGYSGALLTQKYLEKKFKATFSNKMKELVKFANDYDLFKNKYKMSKILNRLFYWYNVDGFIYRFQDGISGLNREEKEFIINNRKYLRYQFKNLKVFRVAPTVLITHTKESNVDEIAEYLYTKHKEIDTVFVVVTTYKKLSLRGTYSGVHFGEFLREWGGGGHKVAGGLALKSLEQMDEIVTKFLEIKPTF